MSADIVRDAIDDETGTVTARRLPRAAGVVDGVAIRVSVTKNPAAGGGYLVTASADEVGTATKQFADATAARAYFQGILERYPQLAAGSDQPRGGQQQGGG